MNKSDEIAKISGYDSIRVFVGVLRRFASDPGGDTQDVFLDAARVIDCFVTEVDCLTAEIERLSDKIDDLKEVTAWNVALSDAEIAALARGVNPASIRPDAIIDPGRIA